jgi:hypothetical protein
MIDLTKYGMNEIREMKCIVVPSCSRCGFFDATSESCGCTNQFIADTDCPYPTVDDTIILLGGMVEMTRKEELEVEINELIKEETETNVNPKIDILIDEYHEILMAEMKEKFLGGV